jgi:hypothetical protein
MSSDPMDVKSSRTKRLEKWELMTFFAMFKYLFKLYLFVRATLLSLGAPLWVFQIRETSIFFYRISTDPN